jgi:tetratricopeptide (TPR) repeat protein
LTGALSFLKEDGLTASAEGLPAQKELYYSGLTISFIWAAGRRMRSYRLMTSGAALALWPLAVPGTDPQIAHDAAVCASAPGAVAADDRIAACTRAINWGEWRGKDVGWAYVDRCGAESEKGANDEAVSDCTKAIRLNSKDAVAFTNRGRAWHAKGDNDRAIADYNEAIRLNPKDAVAFNNRGKAWFDKGESDRAIADYDEAIRLNPKDAVAFNNRGRAWVDKGESDRAIADCDEAIRLDPKNAAAFNNRGSAWQAKGDYDRAIAEYDEAIRLDPKQAVIFFDRGALGKPRATTTAPSPIMTRRLGSIRSRP